MKIFEDSASHIASNHNLAELYLHAGDWPRMEHAARTALALAEKDENTDAIRDSAILLGTALGRAGKKADEIFARAIALDATSPATDIWGVMLADYLISRRRFEQADAHLQPNESPAVQAVIERARGDLALAMGATHEAAVRYEAALELVRGLNGEAPHVAVEVENAVAKFKRQHGGSATSTDGIQT
jgi:predicted negative regulator of RcsB-dependent stress response